MIESWIGLNSIKKQFQFLLPIFFPFDLWYGCDVVLFLSNDLQQYQQQKRQQPQQQQQHFEESFLLISFQLFTSLDTSLLL
jgi:hypothetical protein